MKTALIIGGGFAGCAAAHQFEIHGRWDVTLVEAAPFLGGGCKTLWHGGHPHTFGPRHFLTKNEAVFEYLSCYLPMRRCAEHEFLTYVERDAEFYQYPIHVDDIAKMPERDAIEDELRLHVEGVKNANNLEEYWVASVGRTLYDKFVDGYSRKMWMLDDNRLIDDFGWSPKGVALKSGPRAAWDSAISAYPRGNTGYDPYFVISTGRANVRLSTRITHSDPQRRIFSIAGEHAKQYDVVVNTISPDLLFDKCYGELPYVGRDFYPMVLPVEFAFPENVYFVYYAGKEKFTRAVEYKKFTHHKAPSTLIGLEVPSKNGRYYPMPFKSEQARAQRYFDEMPTNMFSIGRAGSYRYQVDIDDSIEQAMQIMEKL
jgi:UDP-galactopyranose mutase